jgi:GNAT superfamily N-acetyltransferase
METAVPAIRRELRDGDVEAIADLHRRVYGAEYGMNEQFVAGVERSLRTARERGWPEAGGVWLVDLGSPVVGSAGLTIEDGGWGKVRWVVFEPALRGAGLGRQIIGDVVATARSLGLAELRLDTFSELTAAARIYRSHGFTVVSEEELTEWRDNGPPIVYQHYVASLRGDGAAGPAM